MKILKYTLVVLIALGAYGMPLVNAATLDIRGGTLFGVKGLSVGSYQYDVAFIGGSCVSLFNGCDEPTDFFFNDLDSAHLANIALDAQVFVDSVLGNFDSEPNLTNGCTDPQSCSITTPLEASGRFITRLANLRNSSIEGLDSPNGSGGGIGIIADYGSDTYPERTYAVWSTASPVPILPTIWMFRSALIGMISLLQKSRKA